MNTVQTIGIPQKVVPPIMEVIENAEVILPEPKQAGSDAGGSLLQALAAS